MRNGAVARHAIGRFRGIGPEPRHQLLEILGLDRRARPRSRIRSERAGDTGTKSFAVSKLGSVSTIGSRYMVGPVVTRMVVPSGLAPFTALIPISPSPPVRFSTITLRSSIGRKILRQLPAQPVAAAAGREGKDDLGQRAGLRPRKTCFRQQRQRQRAGHEISTVHSHPLPHDFGTLDQNAAADGIGDRAKAAAFPMADLTLTLMSCAETRRFQSPEAARIALATRGPHRTPMTRPALKNFRRIVVKVGSSLLIDSDAGEVRAPWLSALAADLAKLHGEGRDVLIVSSGSIALGRSQAEIAARRLKLEESQAAAAVGPDRAGADLVGSAGRARHRRRADPGDLAGHRGAAALSQRALDHRKAAGMARGARDQRERHGRHQRDPLRRQ